MPIATGLALGIIGASLAAAGTATSVVGQVNAGKAAQQAGEYNAQVATEQASTAETNQRLQDAQVIASGRAISGASGVDANSGSPLAVGAQNARQSEINALNIRRSGTLQAYSDRVSGANAQAASNINATGTLLTGGAKVGQEVTSLVNTNPKPAPLNYNFGPGY